MIESGKITINDTVATYIRPEEYATKGAFDEFKKDTNNNIDNLKTLLSNEVKEIKDDLKYLNDYTIYYEEWLTALTFILKFKWKMIKCRSLRKSSKIKLYFNLSYEQKHRPYDYKNITRKFVPLNGIEFIKSDDTESTIDLLNKSMLKRVVKNPFNYSKEVIYLTYRYLKEVIEVEESVTKALKRR